MIGLEEAGLGNVVVWEEIIMWWVGRRLCLKMWLMGGEVRDDNSKVSWEARIDSMVVGGGS